MRGILGSVSPFAASRSVFLDLLVSFSFVLNFYGAPTITNHAFTNNFTVEQNVTKIKTKKEKKKTVNMHGLIKFALNH